MKQSYRVMLTAVAIFFLWGIKAYIDSNRNLLNLQILTEHHTTIPTTTHFNTTVAPTKPAPPTKPPRLNGRCDNCTRWKFPTLISPDKSVMCPPSKNNGKVDLFIVIPSPPKHTGERAFIREMFNSTQWPNHTVRAMFVVGNPLSKKEPKPEELAKIIKEEAELNKDIYQSDLWDNYFNMTNIVYNGLNWVKENCPQTKFLIKISDDVVLNIPGILHLIETKGESELYDVVSGDCAHYCAGRDASTGYPFPKKPPHCSGGDMLFSMGLLNKMLSEWGNARYPNPHDDVSMGINIVLTGHCVCHVDGFVGFPYGRRTALEKIANAKNLTCEDVKNYGSFLSGHLQRVGPALMKRFWNLRHCFQTPYESMKKIKCRHGVAQCKSDCYHVEPL